MGSDNIQNATPQQLEGWLAKLASKLEGLAMARAEKRASYENLEDNKSRLKAYYMTQSSAVTQAAKESEVLSSTEWELFLEELAEARKEYFTVSAEYDTCIRKWETIRSILSSKNSERRLG